MDDVTSQAYRKITGRSDSIAMKRRLWSRLTKVSPIAIILMIGLAVPPVVRADEAQAKALLKAMSDYLAEQKAISFKYDANLEVVTNEGQKLTLAGSGNVVVNRPDKIHATRSVGFADLEMVYDGKTMTMLNKNRNLYAQINATGGIDKLFDELIEKHGFVLPAADLLSSNAYDLLMADVTDVKDLGSGVVGGVECDHLAFRSKEVDWQIWIAQGPQPYPCKYVITSKLVHGEPEYSVQLRDWATGSDAAADDFKFKMPANAKKVDISDTQAFRDLPENFKTGER